MASVIWKYAVGFGPVAIQGKPIKLDVQKDLLHCWCLVDLDNQGQPIGSSKNVRIVGTGEEFVGRYIDTVQNKYGLVWHLIED
jgi:hypothetical protein